MVPRMPIIDTGPLFDFLWLRYREENGCRILSTDFRYLRQTNGSIFTEDTKLDGQCRKEGISVLRLGEVITFWQQFGSKSKN